MTFVLKPVRKGSISDIALRPATLLTEINTVSYVSISHEITFLTALRTE